MSPRICYTCPSCGKEREIELDINSATSKEDIILNADQVCSLERSEEKSRNTAIFTCYASIFMIAGGLLFILMVNESEKWKALSQIGWVVIALVGFIWIATARRLRQWRLLVSETFPVTTFPEAAKTIQYRPVKILLQDLIDHETTRFYQHGEKRSNETLRDDLLIDLQGTRRRVVATNASAIILNGIMGISVIAILTKPLPYALLAVVLVMTLIGVDFTISFAFRIVARITVTSITDQAKELTERFLVLHYEQFMCPTFVKRAFPVKMIKNVVIRSNNIRVRNHFYHDGYVILAGLARKLVMICRIKNLNAANALEKEINAALRN